MPRAGYLTPCTFADLMSNGRGSDTMGKSAMAVIDRLVMDMLGTARDEPERAPASCQWGIDNEWLAIETYKDKRFCDVRKPEFTASKTHPYVGGTMDGLVGERGGIEVKCPFNSNEHLKNLMSGKQIEHYKYQMQAYMWIYELDWIDFISFDPRFAEPYQISIRRVQRDDALISAIKARCELAYQIAIDKVKEVENSVILGGQINA